MSVRPKTNRGMCGDIMANGEESEEETVEVGDEEEVGKIRAPMEEDVVKKLQDPLKPAQGESDLRNLMGHIPYRT